MCVFDRLVYALASALHDPTEAHFKTVQQVQTTRSDVLSRELVINAINYVVYLWPAEKR